MDDSDYLIKNLIIVYSSQIHRVIVWIELSIQQYDIIITPSGYHEFRASNTLQTG